MRVLVIEIPGLHLGFPGCYGNDWVATPHLDRLAAEGVVFDQHFADCPTAKVRSAWTGRYTFSKADGENELFSLLNRAEIYCSFQAVDPAEKPACPFAELTTHEHGLVWLEFPSLAPPWSIDEAVAAELLEIMPGLPELETPLTPLAEPPARVPKDWDDLQLARVQAAYGATIVALDEQIGRLLEELAGQEMLLIVTAHRGLGLGEHDIIGMDDSLLHEEAIHLPLLMRLPGGQPAGLRVPVLTQPMDLFPTLLEALKLPVPDGIHGRSLGQLLQGGKEPIREYALVGSGSALVLRTSEWALVHSSDRSRLYDKPDDRWEVNDLAVRQEAWTEALDTVLREFVDALSRTGPLIVPHLPERREVS